MEANNIIVIQFLQQANLIDDPRLFMLRYTLQRHEIPRDFNPFNSVVSAVYVLVCAGTQLFVEAYVAVAGGLFGDVIAGLLLLCEGGGGGVEVVEVGGEGGGGEGAGVVVVGGGWGGVGSVGGSVGGSLGWVGD